MSRTWSSAPGGTFSRRPPDRLSMISTRRPWARKASATWEPMNPAPPVTQTVPLDRSLLMATGAYSKSRASKEETSSDRAARALRALRGLGTAMASGHRLEVFVLEHPQGLFGKRELLGQIGLFHRLSFAAVRCHLYRGRVWSRRENETPQE